MKVIRKEDIYITEDIYAMLGRKRAVFTDGLIYNVASLSTNH